MFAISPLFVCAALSLLRSASAVGTPFGLAAGTTGGGSATPSVPSSLAQLTTWLSDSTARVILLESIYDFTSNEGTTTGTICKPWTCSPNPQFAIDANSWCENDEPSAAKSTATYYVAGTKPLVVASNKTLLGKGSAGGIKGKGLKITGANNIIIQNIKITDINAEYVWVSSTILCPCSMLTNSRMWIDFLRARFTNQSMKSIREPQATSRMSTSITTCVLYLIVSISTLYSDLTNTLVFRYVFPACGRASLTSVFVQIHTVSVAGHAIDPEVGSKILLEGNYFNTVTTPTLAGAGQTYIPTTSAQTAACSSLLGRSCVANVLCVFLSFLAGPRRLHLKF
ncbi:pectate lyase [Mycena albidolilacea]|uniref:pectin lyase n=1 Tax=Mycena albidolilacea TaxID=1033008 RepID=A0AAD6Z0Q2_9AGAR|nr:pectate lyase [Mycena albidolilacea]